MLLLELNKIVNIHRNKKFTGYLKLGIENSRIVSLSLGSRTKEDALSDNFDVGFSNFKENYSEGFYGSVSVSFDFGVPSTFGWCRSYKAEELRNQLSRYAAM